MTEHLSSKNVQKPKHNAYAKVVGLESLQARPSLFCGTLGISGAIGPGAKRLCTIEVRNAARNSVEPPPLR